ncbi:MULTISPECIES: DJ-1/PfpI family protein [unclassified Arsenophonus]|uniref:DJ-1/PfpI family protein n=1 Tax=unclassified Arsenophonus TaxID=2627083 RepID=UPI00285639E0|nr:DJ-1/PfpI family protein [Arsenophonus sp.]MDR5610918.1 DJ-1/PfpI family protein [Arsenophonus sp.]MDR5614786.1 DJ-1/PfpI family protein [Arsenophonus sp.]
MKEEKITTEKKDLVFAFVLFPGMTPLDIIGPATLLQNQGFTIGYVWHDKQPISTEINCVTLRPTTTFDELDAVDILCITGSHNPFPALNDTKMLKWIHKVGQNAKYITSVCNGSMFLAAVNLLDNYRSSVHWSCNEFLAKLGATVSNERVTIDRNRISGGGVTAGIDFGLRILSIIKSETDAKVMQLLTQYDPQPPFQSGNPATAEPEIVNIACDNIKTSFETETPDYLEILERAIERKKDFINN